MAEHDYVRLAAACHCGQPVKLWTGRGRKPKYCEPHSTPEKRSGGCDRCGEPLPAGQRRWCSSRCREGTKLSREEHVAQRRAAATARNGFSCEHCGALAARKLSGTNKAKGSQNRFCSMACRVAKAALERPGDVCAVYFNECRVCRKQWTDQRRRHYCGEPCVKLDACRKVRAAAEARHNALGRVVHCEDCGLAYCPVYGAQGAQSLCSPCAAIRRRRWRAMDGGSNVQRAKRAGVEYRYFNPARVLERDGWTCQLCGSATPKDARGSFRSDAPEFDHCIPLALGGPHVPENGQCLCRVCNGRKGDGLCDRSVAAALARGVKLPDRALRKAQERKTAQAALLLGHELIAAPEPA
jgi:hypothetical protein